MSTSRQHYFETWVAIAEEPLIVATRLAASGLHSDYAVYENNGTWSYAGGMLVEVTLNRRGASLRGTQKADFPWDERPLQRVHELLTMIRVQGWRAYGWVTFELSYAKNGILDHIGDETLLYLVVPHTELRMAEGQAWLRAADRETLSVLVELLTTPLEERERSPRPINVRRSGKEEYRDAVVAAVGQIQSGELQKVILSRIVEVEPETDLAATYLLGRRGNNPARSFLLDLGGVAAAGFSPEIVLQVTADGRVTSQPLAGTRALTGDSTLNARMRSDLLTSAKEIYEHAISVKVGNDELLTVCEPNSVSVTELMTVRERGSVQHLASKVSGTLAEGRNAWDAFDALFPAVTASGVPKEAAYTAIRRYETEQRGLYSGAVLTVDQNGELDAALVLRSIYRKNGRTWLRAGAGIVGQSQPEREFEETSEKLDSVARFLVPASCSAALPEQKKEGVRP